ncbi:MAG: glycosyltransferase family 4 protein [Arcicella sp.]|jgi:glycosyltransferase involved in cell wall biosynthesis|nr:glycosyltransferase family 4 protein [Arcicella sp.]
MKAILDVSLLGQGFYHPKARTGVFRVAENLAHKLPSLSSDLEILLAENIDLVATLGYLVDSKNEQNVEFVNYQSEVSTAQRIAKILSIFPNQSKIQKILKRFSYEFSTKEKKLDANLLNTAQVYHSPYYPFPEQILANKRLKKIITIHDLIPVKYPQYFQNQSDNTVHHILQQINTDTHAICVSEATKNDFLEITQVPSSQVTVIPLAASKELFYPVSDSTLIQATLKKFSIDATKPYFLSLATLEPRKNIETVIRSFVDLVSQEKIEDLQLVLVGTKGWDFDKIFEAINTSEKLKSRIIVTGYVPDDALAALYSGALGFVYMSHCEGFGLPPLEAMQCGTPVICSNTTSLPEVVNNAGFLIDPTDNEAVSRAMLELYNNTEFTTLLKTNSLSRAKDFSWEKFAEQTFDFYKKIV